MRSMLRVTKRYLESYVLEEIETPKTSEDEAMEAIQKVVDGIVETQTNE